MSEPLVSVVIPCFNGEGFVAEAIESALKQTHSEIDVVVIDDGSMDRSLEIIQSFGEQVRWETGPQRGGPAARNRGIELALAERILFLDADDVLFPHCIARHLEAAAETHADIVFCDWESMAPDGRITIFSPPYDDDDDDPIVFVAQHQLQITSVLHKKQNLANIGGFREDLPCSQERDLHLRLACEGHSFHHVCEALYRVRKRTDSVSSDYELVLDQHEDTFWHAYRLLDEKGWLTDSRARALAERMAEDARHYLRLSRTAKARAYRKHASDMHRSGGLGVYPGVQRILYHTLGPVMTEKLVLLRRRLAKQGRRT